MLVVSQKKAALDVVYNRLGNLNSKAMYINDECKEKRVFYDRCLTAHQNDMQEGLVNIESLSEEYDTLAGFILSRVEGIPKAGEVIKENNVEIRVLRSTSSRVDLAKVRIV